MSSDQPGIGDALDARARLTPREQRVIEACDAVFDDTLALTRDLVREYSVLGHEQGAVAVMEAWYRRLGLAVERVPLTASAFDASLAGRDNVVARLNPDADGPHLVFNGHLDVVPAEPVAMWTRPPWEPWERDGWLYGRGAGDMKAGIAAMVSAVAAVQRAGVPIDFPLTLQAVIEEECTGNGALACIQHGMGGDFVLIPEPFGATLTSGQVGVLWFRVRLDGVPAHVLDTRAGSNAIEAMTRLLPALKALEAEINALPREAPYAHLESPFNLSVGRLDGGNWASSVPSHAVLEGRMGFPPGMAVEEAMRRIRACIEGARDSLGEGVTNLHIDFHGFRSEGHRVDLDHPGIRLLGDCHQALLGEPISAEPLTCTTDLRAFHVAAGVAGTCYGPVAERIHGVDERVDIASIRHTLKAYALFLCRWGDRAMDDMPEPPSG